MTSYHRALSPVYQRAFSLPHFSLLTSEIEEESNIICMLFYDAEGLHKVEVTVSLRANSLVLPRIKVLNK